MFEFAFCDFDQFDVLQPDCMHWYPVQMPGDSIRHLLDAGIESGIPALFDSTRKFFKYESMDFVYRTRFEAEPGNHYRFICDGLDTIADIYLNGCKIHESRSAFIRLDLELSEYAKPGTNELIVHFISPTEFIKCHRPDFERKSMNVLFDEKWRAYLRKPQWHYGWDNAPHLAGVGFIGEPQIVECAMPLHISNLLFDQRYDWENNCADFAFRMDATVYQDCNIHFQLVFNGAVVWQSEPYSLVAEEWVLHAIPGGHLAEVHEWNCVGMGDPNLYALNVLSGTKTIYQTTIGFRHVELSREVVEKRMLDYRVGSPDRGSISEMDGGADISTDEKGQLFNGAWSHIKLEPYETDVEDFCVVVNGERVFIEGFDWQPVEYNLSNVDPAKLLETLEKMAALQVNSVRIWGGAYIEDKTFYDFCDQHGIIVWQDFQFACSLYPDNDEYFRALVRTEITDIFKRLINHPSLGVFCGSNEIDMVLYDKGLDFKSNNSIGYELIPETLRALECPVPYHVSSPAGAEYPRHPFSGECRNWSTMTHVGDDYSALRADESIMVSEGGCAAYPGKEQCEQFIRPEWALHEDSLLEHQEYQIHAMNTYHHQHLIKPTNIHQTIREYFGQWQNLDEMIYLSQLYQAEGLRRYSEIFRYKQQTMHGYYIWKFADSWPCFSLSVLDYHNMPKMAYHVLKRTMGDLTISPFFDDAAYTFGIFSRQPGKDFKLSVKVYDFNGDVLEESQENIPVLSRGINHSNISLSKQELTKYGLAGIVIAASLKQHGCVVYERLYFPVPLKQLDVPLPDIDAVLGEAKLRNGHFRHKLMLTAKAMTIGINIRSGKAEKKLLGLSDNCFDMLPNTKRTVILTSDSKLNDSDLIIETYNHIRDH